MKQVLVSRRAPSFVLRKPSSMTEQSRKRTEKRDTGRVARWTEMTVIFVNIRTRASLRSAHLTDNSDKSKTAAKGITAPLYCGEDVVAHFGLFRFRVFAGAPFSETAIWKPCRDNNSN